MPSGTLPNAGSLGDPQVTTGDYQTQINQLLTYVRSLQSEVAALSGTTLREGAVRGVGNGAGLVPDKAVLDARLGTGGKLGAAAQKNTGTASTEVPLNSDLGSASLEGYQEATISLGGDFVVGSSGQVKCARAGAIVTITGIENFLDHTNGLTQPASAAGAIPPWARPATGWVVSLYGNDSFSIYEVEVSSAGILECRRRRRDSGDLEPGNTVSRPTIAYATTVSF